MKVELGKKQVEMPNLKKSTFTYGRLDLRLVASNAHQSRGCGLMPEVEAAGYGLFKPLEKHPDNKPLWELLLSKSAEETSLACQIIDKYAPDIKDLAGRLLKRGQLQNIGISPAVSDTGKTLDGQWNLVFGARRAVAKAYLVAQSGGKLPAEIEAKVCDAPNETDLFWIALDENNARKQESIVDRAKFFKQLKTGMGMDYKQIAEYTGEEYQTVRLTMQVLQLPQETQDKIVAGTVSFGKAYANWKKGHAKPEEGAEKATERLRVPTMKQTLLRYNATAADEVTEEVTAEEYALITEDVRKWMAFHVKPEGGYQNRRDLKKAKEAAEKAEHEAEQVRRAAEALEAENAKTEEAAAAK